MNITEMKFDFKTPKTKMPDGSVVEGTKRPSVTLKLPVPSWEEVCGFEGKERDLVMESITDTIYGQARSQINEAIKAAEDAGTTIEITQEVLVMEQLTWNFIANMPPARRGAAKITDEQWEAFAADYVGVMLQVTKYNETQLKGQAAALSDRFNSKGVKGQKKVITLLQKLLNQWFAATTAAEEHFAVYKFLDQKATSILTDTSENKMAELFGDAL